MELLGGTKGKIFKDKDDKNVPHLEIIGVVLVYRNIVSNDYPHNSRILYTFVPNDSFAQSSNIPPRKLIFVKTLDSEFSEKSLERSL